MTGRHRRRPSQSVAISAISGYARGCQKGDCFVIHNYLKLVCFLLLLSFKNALAEEMPTFADVKPILDQKCVMCHSGSMDLRTFPFRSFLPTQERLVTEMIRRFRLDTWQRMPPPRVSAESLTETEIAIFEQWLAGGLLGEPQ